MPIDYSKYPADWKAIRARILERDGNKCAFCNVANYDTGTRDASGKWHSTDAQIESVEETGELPEGVDMDSKIIKIVLTVAHLDHDVANNAESNLAALCQRCHLRYDAAHHAKNAKATRDRKRGQVDMLELPAQEGGTP